VDELTHDLTELRLEDSVAIETREMRVTGHVVELTLIGGVETHVVVIDDKTRQNWVVEAENIDQTNPILREDTDDKRADDPYTVESITRDE
jgi:hypothetical protein